MIGLDIGGANLKAAHSGGSACSIPFALYREPARLPTMLASLLEELPPGDVLAVTMTGELCDCFATKREGVNRILDGVERVAGGRLIQVWQIDGRFVSLEEARRDPLSSAASNWLALAACVGLWYPDGFSLLLDVGSTTTDIIPILNGQPVPLGRTDLDRLRSGELLYTGVLRTPVCALLGADGAAEFFATMHDVYLVLGMLPEDSGYVDMADGRPAVLECSHARLARMLCADLETSTERERLELARRLARKQQSLIASRIQQVDRRIGEPPRTVILAGSGAFLGEDGLKESGCLPGRVHRLADVWNPALSQAACAYAVAQLCTPARHAGER